MCAYGNHPESTEGNNGKTEGSALESAEGHVTASTGTDCPCDVCCKSFTTAFSAILGWAEDNGLIRQISDYDFFGRPPDGAGDEHEAWFEENSSRWFKATYDNEFGLAWGRLGTATAKEYLTRWVLQNQFFGDDIHLVALVNSNSKMRVLISQPHIEGDPASPSDIENWFISIGFSKIDFSGSVAWYLEEENLLVADAHEGNVLRSPSGDLIPIDLNIVKPAVHLLEAIVDYLKKNSN
jgi:hypothetical protein